MSILGGFVNVKVNCAGRALQSIAQACHLGQVQNMTSVHHVQQLKFFAVSSFHSLDCCNHCVSILHLITHYKSQVLIVSTKEDSSSTFKSVAKFTMHHLHCEHSPMMQGVMSTRL